MANIGAHFNYPWNDMADIDAHFNLPVYTMANISAHFNLPGHTMANIGAHFSLTGHTMTNIGANFKSYFIKRFSSCTAQILFGNLSLLLFKKMLKILTQFITLAQLV